jgi:hypothetical protein
LVSRKRVLLVAVIIVIFGVSLGGFLLSNTLNSLSASKTIDSDGDGLSDWDEVNVYNTDPHKVDTDGDYVGDGYEVHTSHTNPLKVDSDGGV